MDHQTFDRMTRLFGTAGSRRTAFRALIAGSLLGATTRGVAAKPCGAGRQLCGNSCCPGKCFRKGSCEVCCTGRNIICITAGGPVCCLNDGKDPCAVLQATGECQTPDGVVGESGDLCTESIAGSYRRR